MYEIKLSQQKVHQGETHELNRSLSLQVWDLKRLIWKILKASP